MTTSSFTLTRFARYRHVAEFWRWWCHEQGNAFAPLRNQWRQAGGEAIAIGWDGVALKVAEQVIPLTKSGMTEDERTRLLTVLGNRRDIRLLVDGPQVLKRVLKYPAAALEDIRQVVSFDLDRQTPFNAQQALFDVRPETPHADQKATAESTAMVAVELVVVPRQPLQPLLEALRSAGLRIQGIGVANDTGAQPFDLLPVDERLPRRLAPPQWAFLGGAALMVVLLLAAVFIPVWQKRERVLLLLPQADQARREADVTHRFEEELAILSRQHEFIVGRKLGQWPVIQILDELTRLTPDNTWLQTLELKTQSSKSGTPVREIQLTGETASTSKMLELLEQSSFLQNASQRSQTSRGSQAGVERFNIATEIKARALPMAEPPKPAETVPVPTAKAAGT